MSIQIADPYPDFTPVTHRKSKLKNSKDGHIPNYAFNLEPLKPGLRSQLSAVPGMLLGPTAHLCKADINPLIQKRDPLQSNHIRKPNPSPRIGNSLNRLSFRLLTAYNLTNVRNNALSRAMPATNWLQEASWRNLQIKMQVCNL